MSLHVMNLGLRAAAAVGLLLATLSAPAYAQDDANPAPQGASEAAAENAPAQETPLMEGFASLDEQASYAVGLMIGQQLSGSGMSQGLSIEQITEGLRAALQGGERKLDDQQVMQTMMAYQQKSQEQAAQRNQAEAQEFLAQNKDAEGVVTLPSGLQYKITEQGDGEKPQPTDTVSIHYTGKLLDGTVFDSSVQRGEPASFPLDRVIPGFSEGLSQLPVGSKATLYIPGDMAYGMNPQPGGPIGPNAMLIFDVELLGIEEPTPDAGQTPAE